MKANSMSALDSKVTFIPDVHGDNDALHTTLVESGHATRTSNGIEIHDGGLIVCKGDYIDRGPDNLPVLDTLLQLLEQTRTKLIAGNHELMMLEAMIDDISEYGAYWLQEFSRRILSEVAAVLNRTYSAENPDPEVAWLREALFSGKYRQILDKLQVSEQVGPILAMHAIPSQQICEKTTTPITGAEQLLKGAVSSGNYSTFNDYSLATYSLVWGTAVDDTQTFSDWLTAHNAQVFVHGHTVQQSGVQGLEYLPDDKLRIAGDISMSRGYHNNGWGYTQWDRETGELLVDSKNGRPVVLGTLEENGRFERRVDFG